MPPGADEEAERDRSTGVTWRDWICSVTVVTVFFGKLRKPGRIGCVLHEMPIKIRLPIVPPHLSPLAESDLGFVDPRSRLRQRYTIAFGLPNRSPRGHQFLDQPYPGLFIQSGIAFAPEAPAEHEVPTIRRVRVREGLFTTAHSNDPCAGSKSCCVSISPRFVSSVCALKRTSLSRS